MKYGVFRGKNRYVSHIKIRSDMLLLSSMTGATPEIRLVLLAWAAFFGNSFQSGEINELASTLKVSKRHFRSALKYLVREGYICKCKSVVEQTGKKKSKLRFVCCLTNESWNMWNELVASCKWMDELRFALLDVGTDGTYQSGQPIVISESMRLVRAALLIMSNNAGYIIGCNSKVLCKMLGMSEVKFRQTIDKLAKINSIKIATKGAARSELLNRILPIYQIRPKIPAMCTIKLGVSLSRLHLLPLQFTENLALFHRRVLALKQTKKNRYPNQNSLLSNEQYWALSKRFNNKELTDSIHHMCMSTVLSLVPLYVSGSLSKRLAKPEAIDALKARVTLLLSEGFLYEPQAVPKVRNSKQKDIDTLKDFTFHALTEEVVNLILELSKSWLLFKNVYGDSAKLIDYLPNHQMVAIATETNEMVAHQQCKDGQDVQQDIVNDINTIVFCVLSVSIPKQVKDDDCMILGRKLLTVNSRAKDVRIQRIKRLILSEKVSFQA
ncbi:hypothetical protein [Shewanella xiamenensis]|uniref:hypothetical protein n=1 Tax=Shewanella xiamenensis TaxID=332186 RepID=UPI000F8368B2